MFRLLVLCMSFSCINQRLVCQLSLIIIITMLVFYNSISCWSFTEVWVTASFLKSPRLFLEYCLIFMVSTHPLISKSSSLCTKPLGIVPSTPITIGITITLIFQSFFSSLGRYKYLSLFLLSLIFTLQFSKTAKSTIQ